MNPACTARGIRRWCARWASWIVFARLASWSSLRRSRGRFLRKSRAIAGSPERASSISAEHTVAASAAARSAKTPRKTHSATSSSLSCRSPAMSRPRGSSRRSRTAPNCSSTSTTRRNSCQYALLTCSSARCRTPRRSVSVSSSRHSRSHRGWALAGGQAGDRAQAGPPLAPEGGEPAGLGLGDAPFSPAPAPAERLAPGLRLLTRAPVAPDAREVAARRRVALDLREGRLEGPDLALHLTDALEVLVLAERRLDPPPEGLRGRAGGEEKRGG